jgi:spore maturation protein CgeB
MVFLGDEFYGSTSVQRMRAFRHLGHTVHFVPRAGGLRTDSSLCRRLRYRLGYPCETSDENRRLLAAVQEASPEMVWIEKGLTLWPRTLAAIKRSAPACRLVSFSADDMMNPGNQSAYWRRGFRLYDLHVTTKTPNLDEFARLGARGVVFMAKAFDPETHRPMELSPADRQKYASDVAFPGTFERERGESVAFLANHGVTVRVWGSGWSGLAGRFPSLRIEGGHILGEEYAKAINAAKIVLCFLRKANRDRQTARSVEIPACGAFMLAERTEEHQALFREDVEAAYFGSDEELVAKVRHYLANEEERIRIAGAGRQRCLDGGYSHASRLEAVLRACFSPAPAARQTGPFNQVWRAS